MEAVTPRKHSSNCAAHEQAETSERIVQLLDGFCNSHPGLQVSSFCTVLSTSTKYVKKIIISVSYHLEGDESLSIPHIPTISLPSSAMPPIATNSPANPGGRVGLSVGDRAAIAVCATIGMIWLGIFLGCLVGCLHSKRRLIRTSRERTQSPPIEYDPTGLGKLPSRTRHLDEAVAPQMS